jgi:hypothetical protein
MIWCFLRASAYVMGDDGWEWTGLKELTRLLARDENQGPRVKIYFMFSLIFSPPIFFISFVWGPVLTRYWRLWMFGCMKRIKAITIRRLFFMNHGANYSSLTSLTTLLSETTSHERIIQRSHFVRESHPSVDSIPIRLSSTGASHRTISPVPFSWRFNHPRNEIGLLEKKCRIYCFWMEIYSKFTSSFWFLKYRFTWARFSWGESSVGCFVN